MKARCCCCVCGVWCERHTSCIRTVAYRCSSGLLGPNTCVCGVFFHAFLRITMDQKRLTSNYPLVRCSMFDFSKNYVGPTLSVCMSFTLNRSFYINTRRHPAHLLITHKCPCRFFLLEVQALWSQNHNTEILHCYAVSGVDNAMNCHRTGYDRYDIYIANASNADQLTERKNE